MRAWVLTMLLTLALEGLCGCICLLRDTYLRPSTPGMDVGRIIAVMGLLAWGVHTLRGG